MKYWEFSATHYESRDRDRSYILISPDHYTEDTMIEYIFTHRDEPTFSDIMYPINVNFESYEATDELTPKIIRDMIGIDFLYTLDLYEISPIEINE